MAQSSIEWTGYTWNPTTGCDKISAGCKFCYAETMAKRLQGMKSPKYIDGFRLRTHEHELKAPYSWHSPRIVFVDSMSDLFHKSVPLDFIKRVFEVMNNTPMHTYQVLTKRADLLLEYSSSLSFTSNIWIGVSVEDARVIDRINYLQAVPAHVRFLSVEPLIGPLSGIELTGIHWVIVGGESGRNPRRMDPQWVTDILHQCERAEVPFFFKQWGGRDKKRTGRLLNGRTYDAMPVAFSKKL